MALDSGGDILLSAVARHLFFGVLITSTLVFSWSHVLLDFNLTAFYFD